MFRIQCKVSGGVTGTRTGFLHESGVMYSSDNEEEAKTKARLLTEQMNRPNATAHYTYWVV